MKNFLYRLVTFGCFLGMIPAVLFWWQYRNGLMLSDLEAWRFFLELITTEGFPKDMMISALVIIGLIMVFWLGLTAICVKSGAVTVGGGRGVSESHGSARFATLKEIKAAGFLGKEGVVIGGYKVPFKKGIQPLRDKGKDHILCFAPTRTGKGVSLIVNTLLDWKDSAIVLDIKGENFALTSGYRASCGQKILKFEPMSVERSARYNPLEEIRKGTEYEISDCQLVAINIINTDGKGLNEFFRQSAFEWLSGVLLHVIHLIEKRDKRPANLTDVYEFLSGAGEEDKAKSPLDIDEDDDKSDGFKEMCDSMIHFDHGSDDVNKAVRHCAEAMKIVSGPQRSGVHSTVTILFALYADPIVASNMKTSDFRIKDLMDGEAPLSLYLVFDPDQRERLKPIFRLLLEQCLGRLTSKMEFEDGKMKARKHRLLLMLDEFPTLGKLEVISSALAYMAGYGIRAYLITQDITQLFQAYGKDEEIRGNCTITNAFTPASNKEETPKLLSMLCGQTTIQIKRRSVSGGTSFGAAKSVSESTQESGRPLMTPDEILNMRGLVELPSGGVRRGQVLLFTRATRPILGEQSFFFEDPEKVAKTQIPAVQTLPSKEPHSLVSSNASQAKKLPVDDGDTPIA